MRAFVQYILCVVILIGATYAFVPWFYGVNYPKPPGPAFDPSIRTIFQQGIDKSKPQIVLIGDSLASVNIDPVILSNNLGKSVYDVSLPGSASTLWYLITKNNIATAKYKPEYLIVLFRDTMLTTPDYRVQGSYFQQIDEFANSNDKLLIQLAFVNKMNWLDKLADQYIPPYGSRLKFRATMDGQLRGLGPRLLLSCDNNCVDDSLSTVFRSDNFLSKVMGDAINSADKYLYTDQNLDFSHQIGQSFLPEIVRLCKENNIQLILIRSKTLAFTPQSPAPAGLAGYITQLASYAKQNNVIYLDYSNDQRITPDFYFDPVHFNDAVREKFTGFLSESLAPFMH